MFGALLWLLPGTQLTQPESWLHPSFQSCLDPTLKREIFQLLHSFWALICAWNSLSSTSTLGFNFLEILGFPLVYSRADRTGRMCDGASQQQVQVLSISQCSGACSTAPSGRSWWQLPKLMWKPKAGVKD